MTGRSKTKRHEVRRPEQRKRLHEAVDRVLDGPGNGDVDQWVRQVLVDIGLVVQAAAPALDYEVGRIISGVDRPRGDFPSNLSWQGAEIDVTPQRYNAWKAAGEAARGDPPSLETQQRALAALLRPVGRISCHIWLDELADALVALSFGEVMDPLKPSDQGLWAIGKGMTAWQLRLAALRWVEFQIGAGKVSSKNDAYKIVACRFGPRFDTVKDWRRTVANKLGEAVVHEELMLARRIGELVQRINGKIAMGEAHERDRRYCIHLEEAYSDEKLEELGEKFKDLPRQKHRGQLRLPQLRGTRNHPSGPGKHCFVDSKRMG